jgi:hypothetical protein
MGWFSPTEHLSEGARGILENMVNMHSTEFSAIAECLNEIASNGSDSSSDAFLATCAENLAEAARDAAVGLRRLQAGTEPTPVAAPTVEPGFYDGVDSQDAWLAWLQRDGWDMAKLQMIGNDSHAGEPDFESVTAEQWQAWLNLISAAPRLLAASEAVANQANEPHKHNDWIQRFWGLMEELRNAIRDAKGGAE